MSVYELLEGKRVCVCAGSGGVGKTTTSAAIALGMAAHGARVAVVTIDPAKRLANALGLEELHNDPRLVPAKRLPGIECKGELWAMMLDPKQTFDELIDRIATDPERAQEIKANRVYRELSTAVSGSQEFTAIAKLYDLDREGRFDLLVLDTPPSRNALDFLDAPGRLTSFLDGRGLRAFAGPTGVGMRVLGRSMAPLLVALRRVTGADLVDDLMTFFALLGSMTTDFSLRAKQVQEMLHASTSAFLLISSAAPAAIDEAIWFRRTLQDTGLPFAGVVVNRFHHDVLEDMQSADLTTTLARQLADELELAEEVGRRLAENLGDYHLLAQRDKRNVQRLAQQLDGRPLLLVPHFDDDVHDVGGLLAVQRYLFASAPERDALIAELVA